MLLKYGHNGYNIRLAIRYFIIITKQILNFKDSANLYKPRGTAKIDWNPQSVRIR